MVLKKFSLWKKKEEKEKPQGHRGMNERERLIDLFIHDLASPLSIISTSVSNLLYKTERYGPISDHQRRLLERISRNNRKAQLLLNEMIEIARSKEGFFRKESFEIEKIIQNSLSDALEHVVMGVRGFDLLTLAVSRNFPVAMLTAHALTSEALKRSIELKARAYLPKEKLGEVVPFLEDILKHEYLPGWKLLLDKLTGFFNGRWGDNWQRSDEKFWKEFKEKIVSKK
ncbi:MAG: hypothetical protein QME90_18545 [Thermodesulfobacteriota bacterium]|nr:hypothetical protein [Thermodesulfobacteriota bacterium]